MNEVVNQLAALVAGVSGRFIQSLITHQKLVCFRGGIVVNLDMHIAA